MNEHTPGPWTFGVYQVTENFRKINLHSCVCKPDTMLLIAACGPAEDIQSQKDAELISAAPDLYTALKALLEACILADVQGELSEIIGGELLDAAGAAIDKVEVPDAPAL